MSLAALARLQQGQRAPLRDQQRRGEVVDLHPLPQELRVVLRHRVVRARRGRGPAGPAIGSRADRRPVAAGRSIRWARSVTVRVDSGRSRGVHQPEAQMGGEPVDHGAGDRPAVVLGGGQQVGGDRLDLAEVVAAAGASARAARRWPGGPAPGWRPARPGPRPAPGAGRPATPAPRSAAAAPAGPPGSPAPGTQSARCAFSSSISSAARRLGAATASRSARSASERRRQGGQQRTAWPPACRSRSATAPTAQMPRGRGDVGQRQARRPCAGAAAVGRSSADRAPPAVGSSGADRPCAVVASSFATP